MRELPRYTRPNTQGFTLIEAVVALTVLALTCSAVYPIFGATLRSSREQRQRESAWLIAQSLLDQVRSQPELHAGRMRGRTQQALEWETAVAPWPSTVTHAPQLFEVTVRVSWGSVPARRVELHSLELGEIS